MHGLGSEASVASLAKLPRRKVGTIAVWRRKQTPCMPRGVPDCPARRFFVPVPEVTVRNPLIKSIIKPTKHCNYAVQSSRK
jgi:hypothetical protein